MKKYYEILEVNKNASNEVIDRAYKVLVRKYHPDLNRGEKDVSIEKKIRELNEAHDVLMSEVLRDQYDRELEEYEFENMMRKSAKYMEKENSNEYDYNNTSKQTKFVRRKEKDKQTQDETYQVGTLGAIINIFKSVFTHRKSNIQREKFNKTTAISILLTILILAVLGIAMWFIPFTNDFIRSLTVDNPLINWMF